MRIDYDHIGIDPMYMILSVFKAPPFRWGIKATEGNGSYQPNYVEQTDTENMASSPD